MKAKKMIIRKGIFAFLLIFLLISCAPNSETRLERKIERVEQGLLAELSDPPWKRMGLTDRMEYYKVPGVSIAVINNFQIEWTKGYGVLEAGKGQPVTTETLFQPGSTAKPMTASVALYYVEAGVLELDSDVNNYTGLLENPRECIYNASPGYPTPPPHPQCRDALH